jgi:hypothetical protein
MSCIWYLATPLAMENPGEQINLRQVRGTPPLAKEHGVWVARFRPRMKCCNRSGTRLLTGRPGTRSAIEFGVTMILNARRVAAQRIALQPVANQSIQTLEALAHVRSTRRRINPRRRTKAEHCLQPLQHSHQSRQRRCVKALANFDPALTENYSQAAVRLRGLRQPRRHHFHRNQRAAACAPQWAFLSCFR